MRRKQPWAAQARGGEVSDSGRLDPIAVRALDDRQRFAAQYEGRTQHKPKFISDPETNALYRLVVRAPGQHSYAESPIESQSCYRLTLGMRAKKALRNSEQPTLPAPYHIQTFRYNTSYPIQLPAIQFRDVHTILHGLSRLRGWSVTEETSPLKTSPFLVNVLFEDERIVGIRMWSTEKLFTQNCVEDGFFILHPDVQGKGLGQYLLDYTNRQILQLRPHAELAVHTSDFCQRSPQHSAKDFYRAQGYRIARHNHFTYEKYKNGTAREVPVTVPESFFRDPETGDELPRFAHDRLARELDRTAQRLLAPRGRG